MKLFEKYLLACTNQRIPMPKEWQKSLGLDLDERKQVHDATRAEITGYRFQQDDTLERGFVHREVRSLELDEQARYLIGLYLNAIKEHRGTDFTPYFNVGVSIYQFPYYVTKVPIIRNEVYSIYGSTLQPVQARIYSEASNVEESFLIHALSQVNHYELRTRIYFDKVIYKLAIIKLKKEEEFIKTLSGLQETMLQEAQDKKGEADLTESEVQEVLDKAYEKALAESAEKLKEYKSVVASLLSAQDEYFMLELKSFQPLTVVHGSYEPIAQLAVNGEDAVVKMKDPKMYPSVGIHLLEYADKLMPLLTDMTITKNSPTEERQLVNSNYYGDTIEDKVKRNTRGLTDVDEFVGGNFLW